MPSPDNPMRALFLKLSAAGIPSSFAKRMLPSWWDDEAANDPAGLQQAQLYLSRAFNIDLRSLADAGRTPLFRANERKYKLSKNVSENDVSASANYVTGIARIALAAYPGEQKAVSNDPVILRNAILRTHECVNLHALLEWCRESHIPVLYIDNVPGKKMTGLVVREKGRYAIVLSKKGHPAHLLFHLAHEIGHIGQQHLSEDGFFADEKIDSKSVDREEKEADHYAICLLNGAAVGYSANGGRASLNAEQLHLAAVNKGRNIRVDPGHIIANYGFNQGRFPVASSALKRLEGPSDGGVVVNQAFFSSIDQELVSDDQLELLKTATEIRA